MGKLHEEVKRVHDNTDFKVDFVGITRLGEFKYTHGGSVQPGLEYHIHYTNDKEEVFMLGGTHTYSSRVIEKIDDKSLFSTYSDLKVISKNSYPKKYNPVPTEADYEIGSFNRYFAQKVNNLNSELFEIQANDYEQNNLFRYIEISWIIAGKKDDVIRANEVTIEYESGIRGNELLAKILFPLQLWKPPKNSPEELQEKLDRLKII
tara:strand:+ start:3005 stop:3622 length:618 start_codon:yes stop_codon:yes gene_type:complete